MGIPIKEKCTYCDGIGKRWVGATGSGQPPQEYVDCTECNATGYNDGESQVDDTLDDVTLSAIAALEVKVDALQIDITKCLRRLKKIMDKLEVMDD